MYYDKLDAEGLMKKLLIILGILFLGNCCFAEDTVITGSVDFNWVNMSQVERDAEISQYQNLIFGDEIQTKIPRKEFRAKYNLSACNERNYGNLRCKSLCLLL